MSERGHEHRGAHDRADGDVSAVEWAAYVERHYRQERSPGHRGEHRVEPDQHEGAAEQGVRPGAPRALAGRWLGRRVTTCAARGRARRVRSSRPRARRAGRCCVRSSRGVSKICAGGPHLEDLAVVEEADGVRDVAGEPHLVSRDDHRHALLRRDRARAAAPR